MSRKRAKVAKCETWSHPFDSMLALSDFIENNAGAVVRDNSFTDGPQMVEVREILKAGGYHAASGEHISKHSIDESKFPQRKSIMPMSVNSVAGHRPNVGAFLAGSPMSMVRNMPAAKVDGRVKILVPSTASCGVDHSTLLKRGAAIMGIIEHLQAEGYAVEVTVGFFMTATNEGTDLVSVPIVVKHYQDTFDPAALGFALAEPSFGRKALFGAMDIMVKQNPDNALVVDMQHGMGYPAKPEAYAGMDYDIIFEAPHYHDRWTDDNSADKAMKKVYEWLARDEVPA
jgi:hypothetical protein